MQSYSEWSINNNSIYSPYFNVLEGGTNIADALKGQLNKVNIGNNSKWYFEQNSGRIFNGNQYVTTTPATIKYSNLIKGDNTKNIIMDTALTGIIFVMACDIIGRIIIYPYEISIGLTVGVLGSIIFLYLITRRSSYAS